MVSVGLLAAPQAFGGTSSERSASVRPALGTGTARADGNPAGSASDGPLSRFRDGAALPFPRLGDGNGPGRGFPRLGGRGGRGGPPASGGGDTADGARDAGAGNGGVGNAGAGAVGGGTNGGDCAEVHLIATRASTEQPGAGIIGSLVDAVQAASSQSTSTDATDYPAVLNPYGPSVAAGVEALTEQLEAQAANCPDQKIVLMGYSQGAHVIGDVLVGGTGGRGLPETAPVDADVAAQVAAVILMGDPTHVPGKPFNAGTAETDGLFARREDASLDAFADRIQSYCDEGDVFCAGGRSIATHLRYTREYNAQAQEFVLDRIGG